MELCLFTSLPAAVKPIAFPATSTFSHLLAYILTSLAIWRRFSTVSSRPLDHSESGAIVGSMILAWKIHGYIHTLLSCNENHSSHNDRKRSYGHVRPAKIQIRLRIRAVWSESSLGAFWIAKDTRFLHVNKEESDHIARMRRLIWVFTWHTGQKVRVLSLRLFQRLVFELL